MCSLMRSEKSNLKIVKASMERGPGSRNEPMWVVIHKCMEVKLGISLYSNLYTKLAKMVCLSY
jgi:hypothetical protein